MPVTAPVRAFDVRVNEFDGKLLLVRRLDAYELADVEAAIWSACDGEHSVQQIVDVVVGRYDVDAETAERDVVAFLAQLTDAGLLE